MTGGDISVVGNDASYRMLCLMYLYLMPNEGLSEAFGGLFDVYNWHTSEVGPIKKRLIPNSYEVSGVDRVSLRPFVFHNE